MCDRVREVGMLPYSQNHHLVADLAHERYKDLRREADAWRLANELRQGAQAPCAPAGFGLRKALMSLRLNLVGAPRTQIGVCP